MTSRFSLPSDARQRIERCVDQLSDQMVEQVSQLVRINTVNPYSGDATAASERPGQLYLKDRLDSAGFATRLFEPPADVYAQAGMIGPQGRSWKDRPNLVGELDFGPGGPTVVLNCHMDTVGAAGMTIEPFSGEVRDGYVWGRGSGDSKGNLVVGLTAVRALQDAGLPLRGRIIFESVVDEECNGGGAGTVACCLAGYRGDVAICLDGIGSVPVIGCNGVLTLQLDTHGQAGHAAAGAVNAIDKARLLCDAMDRIKAEREAGPDKVTVNLGVFHAGSIPAIVPGLATMAYNLTYTPAEAEASQLARGQWGCALLREQIDRLLDDACARDAWLADHRPTRTWVKDLYPFATPADAEIVQLVGASLAELTGRPARCEHMRAWSDACHLSILGGMPTVGFGSATPGMAHADDERIEISRLTLGAKVVASSLARLMTV